MRSEDRRIFPSSLLSHILVLAAGYTAGIAAGLAVSGIPFDFTPELRTAESLGIVSVTTLMKHPKSRDMLDFVALTLMPLFFSVAGWFFWAGPEGRRSLAEFSEGHTEKYGFGGSVSKTALLIVSAVYLYVSFDAGYFHKPREGWDFLGEEGFFLGCMQQIFSGEVYGRDFQSPYGVLLVYPLSWMMKLFGKTVVVQRFYTYGLNLAAYGIILFFLYVNIRNRIAFFVSAAVYMLVFSPFPFAPHISYFRFVFGLLPIIFLREHNEKGGLSAITAAGAAAGASPLVSLEFGVCSFAAAGVYLALGYFAQAGRKITAKDAAFFSAGALLAVLPAVAWYASRGGFYSLLSRSSMDARLYTLGAASLPFPSLGSLFASPFSSGALLPYCMIFSYSSALAYAVVSIFSGRRDRKIPVVLSVAVYGILSFRYALGRSDSYHIFQSSHSFFLLAFMLLDGMLRSRFIKGGLGAAGAAALSVPLVAALAAGDDMIRYNAGVALSSLSNPAGKFSGDQSGVGIDSLPGAGVRFDEKTARSIEEIRRFLRANTADGDYVYFFPNEAAYYFIFNRRNPTRYIMAGTALSSVQRREIVEDLEKNRPRFIVYSLDSWRQDDIPLEFKSPELVEYIGARYSPVENYGDVMIAERRS